MLFRLVLFFLFLNIPKLFAQIEQVAFRNLSDEGQFKFADEYFIKNWFNFYDTQKRPIALKDYEVMLKEARDARTICLLKLFWFRNQLYSQLSADTASARHAMANLDSVLRYVNEHQPELQVEKVICQLELCIVGLMHQNRINVRQQRIQVYDRAVQCLEILESLPASAFLPYHGAVFDIDFHLLWMSTYFFRIEEFEMARRMSLLCNRLTHPVLSTKKGHERDYFHYKWISSINLGNYYLQEGNLKEAANWFQKAYTLGKQQPSEIREAVAGGYIGQVRYREGKPAVAVQLLERAVAVSQKIKDGESEYNALVPLADAYLAIREYDKAHSTIQRAMYWYWNRTLDAGLVMGMSDSTKMVPLFVGLGKVYQHRGDLKQALFYTQLANRLEGKRREQDDARIYRQKQEKLEAEAYRAKLDQIDADRNRAVWLRNASIASLVLISLVSLFYIGYQRRRRRAAEQQLARLVQEVKTRTEQLTHLEQKEDPSASPKPDELPQPTAALLEQAILTEADWERFQQLFGRVYPNFLIRLRATYSTLTPAEIRLICLSRLNLSTREIANMLGVSVDAVFKTRYRIRKKVGLAEGTDLNDAFGKV